MDYRRTTRCLVGTSGDGVPGDRPGARRVAQERRVSRPLARHGSAAQRRHEGRAGSLATRTRQRRPCSFRCRLNASRHSLIIRPNLARPTAPGVSAAAVPTLPIPALTTAGPGVEPDNRASVPLETFLNISGGVWNSLWSLERKPILNRSL